MSAKYANMSSCNYRLGRGLIATGRSISGMSLARVIMGFKGYTGNKLPNESTNRWTANTHIYWIMDTDKINKKKSICERNSLDAVYCRHNICIALYPFIIFHNTVPRIYSHKPESMERRGQSNIHKTQSIYIIVDRSSSLILNDPLNVQFY